jgi:uncharacterized membrane protein YdbT with pleckstrin-like domain
MDPLEERPIVALSPIHWSVFLEWENIKKLIFVFPFFWAWLLRFVQRYHITNRRIRIAEGILRHTEIDYWLFRVVKITLEQSLLHQFLGIANLVVRVNAPGKNQIVLYGIPLIRARSLYEAMELCVQEERRRNPLDVPWSDNT